MFPTDFDQSNKVFDKPQSMTRDECEAVNCFVGKDVAGQDVILTCWKPTREELEEINRTGRVWCYHYGNYLQPHSLRSKSF